MILEKSKASKGVAERRVSCMDQNTQTLRLSSVAPRLHTPASVSGRSAPAAAYNKDVFPASQSKAGGLRPFQAEWEPTECRDPRGAQDGQERSTGHLQRGRGE